MKSTNLVNPPPARDADDFGEAQSPGQYDLLTREVAKRRQIERQLRQLEKELSELKRVEHQLHQLAYYDDLTSLPNRVYFNERLHGLLMCENARATAMFIDLDRFKRLNDRAGHENGNVVLGKVAKRFLQGLPQSALVARYGGDEFSVLLEGDDRKFSKDVAQGILDSLRKPITLLGHRFNVSASVGLSYYPSISKNIPELLRHADTAMYQAKKRGGNQYCVFDAGGRGY